MIRIHELRNAAAGRRWAAYFEGLALAAVVMAVNFAVFPADPGYHSWSFSPYLFVVLVIAGRYGFAPGAFMAVACLGCYLGTLMVVLKGTPLTLILTPPHYGLLVTFSLGALIVGNLADRSRDRLSACLYLHDEVRLRHDRLSGQFTLLSDEKHLLDKQVLAEEETFPALVSMFDDLDHLDPAGIPDRIVKLAPRLMGGGRAALYRVDPGPDERSGSRLRLGASSGGGWDAEMSAVNEVVTRAMDSEMPVSLAELGHIDQIGVLARDPIQLACRLPQSEYGPLLVLLMADLPFAAFSPSRISGLGSGLQVAGKALGRALLFKVTQDRNVEDPITKAASATYFAKRLEEEFYIAQRHGMPLSVLTVQVPGLERRVKKEQHQQLRKMLADAFATALRNGDLLAHHERPGSFTILCPFTPTKGADVVARRLQEKISTMIRQPTVSSGEGEVHVFVLAVDPKKTTLDQLRSSIKESLISQARHPGGIQ